jgi:transposase-like protein
MTHTKKKSSPVNVVDSAWDAFFAEKAPKVHDPDDLRKDGWISVREFEERANLPNTTVRHIIKREGMEVQQFCVYFRGTRRHMNFVRIPAQK